MLSRLLRQTLTAAWSASALLGCGDVHKAMQEAESLQKRYEAHAWLNNNRDHWAFAEHRFHSAAAALAFVDTLYRAGADSVYVAYVMTDSVLSLAHGGPYSEVFIVRLPEDTIARSRLLEIEAREARHSDFQAASDLAQRYLLLWWR